MSLYSGSRKQATGNVHLYCPLSPAAFQASCIIHEISVSPKCSDPPLAPHAYYIKGQPVGASFIVD